MKSSPSIILHVRNILSSREDTSHCQMHFGSNTTSLNDLFDSVNPTNDKVKIHLGPRQSFGHDLKVQHSQFKSTCSSRFVWVIQKLLSSLQTPRKTTTWRPSKIMERFGKLIFPSLNRLCTSMMTNQILSAVKYQLRGYIGFQLWGPQLLLT